MSVTGTEIKFPLGAGNQVYVVFNKPPSEVEFQVFMKMMTILGTPHLSTTTALPTKAKRILVRPKKLEGGGGE